MNFNSPLFDRIRVRPRVAEDVTSQEEGICEHAGCSDKGEFRAPKGRGRERQYWKFCLKHVRAYNQSYNYFDGMSDNDVAAFQKEAVVGHRPTWSMGVNADTRDDLRMRSRFQGREEGESTEEKTGTWEVDDALGLFGTHASQRRRAESGHGRSHLSGTALKALDRLGLDPDADAQTIRARYKLLVKRFHPDANGGDRSLEEQLQEILKAYNTLKTIGLC